MVFFNNHYQLFERAAYVCSINVSLRSYEVVAMFITYLLKFDHFCNLKGVLVYIDVIYYIKLKSHLSVRPSRRYPNVSEWIDFKLSQTEAQSSGNSEFVFKSF